jgi:hypothetical protein
MSEPTPEKNPSYTRMQIAAVCAILKTHKNLDEQEKAEAIKLKAELQRLTSGAFTSVDGIRAGNDEGPDRLPPPDRLEDSDF